jgi:hypothetical protein
VNGTIPPPAETSGGLGAAGSLSPSLPRRLYTFGKIIGADVLGATGDTGEPQQHLNAAIEWLERAHDMGRGGVSYGYGLQGGWRPAYRETSGYISVTLFDVAARLDRPACRRRAIDICRWLCQVQNADGSIANPRFGDEGIVFDTGQVLQGLVRAFRETREPPFVNAAARAAHWLTAVADQDRRWTRNSFRGAPHVYDARTAWALLELHALDPRPAWADVARRNLAWAVEEQNELGWFDHCAFRPDAAPFTHTIAYTLEGLLEAGLLLGETRYVDAARRGADAALRHLGSEGFIPGQIDINGTAVSSYSCLTGNCQLAVVWARLYQEFGGERFRTAARRALTYVMRHQNIQPGDPDIRGAIKGSQPVWGRYSPFGYPAWAAKFFVDAMLLVFPGS